MPDDTVDIPPTELLRKTPEGVLAGEMALLVAEGADPAKAAQTFLRAVYLIRQYGDRRVREARGAH